MLLSKLAYRGHGRLPPAPPEVLRVLYESPLFMMVYKPPDMQMNGDEFEVSVEKLARKQWPNDMEGGHFRPCHQLDYATSGCLLLAKTKKAAGACCRAWMAREPVQKEYSALVFGHIPEDVTETTLTWPLEKDPDHAFKERIARSDSEVSKKCVTHVQVLSRVWFERQPVSLLNIHLITGRRHQIRLHLKEWGYPIVGDATYAEDETSPRMFLEARSLKVRLAKGKGMVQEEIIAADTEEYFTKYTSPVCPSTTS